MYDCFVGQFALGWHLYVAVVVYGFDEQALVRLAGHNDGPVIAAFEQGGARIQTQSALLAFGSMAGLALGNQHGTDVLLKELDGLRLGRGSSAQRDRQKEASSQSEKSQSGFHISNGPYIRGVQGGRAFGG
jgi:hypothetical protein